MSGKSPENLPADSQPDSYREQIWQVADVKTWTSMLTTHVYSMFITCILHMCITCLLHMCITFIWHVYREREELRGRRQTQLMTCVTSVNQAENRGEVRSHSWLVFYLVCAVHFHSAPMASLPFILLNPLPFCSAGSASACPPPGPTPSTWAALCPYSPCRASAPTCTCVCATSTAKERASESKVGNPD